MTADDHDVLIVLVKTVETGFVEVNRRFDEMNKRLDESAQATDKRFESYTKANDQKIEKHDGRISALESKMNKAIGFSIVLGGIFGVAGGKILHAFGF
jgi:hypothetical protein